ncbi:MAG: tetratricopeptide repeat protein [Candidatus Heimdallarchaeota archaeon]
MECFKTAVEIEPKYFEALHNLASAYEEAEDFDKAAEYEELAYGE